ncbi:hypothetical protein B0T18DRAFT_473660 [Schizothecium vesticola]|uniref:Uncharacterized protein n=1 Tax=Schizothecium vesticola TaxID=314040 RepID=A0AA40BP69_9PEZI|nr:hypothetical protein B0T18DRAFT_473660 [Schizothecium vesticola]
MNSSGALGREAGPVVGDGLLSSLRRSRLASTCFKNGRLIGCGLPLIEGADHDRPVRSTPASAWRVVKRFNCQYLCEPDISFHLSNTIDETGLRDSNSARRNITERYLLECDKIFAVCNTGRAVTDESVEEVFNRAKRAELSNVSIICTKSDQAPVSFSS